MDQIVRLTWRDRIRVEVGYQRELSRRFWHDTLPRWVAWHLPRQVVYHAIVRAWVFSLSGDHAHLTPTEVHTFETVQRWDRQVH